jgi:hypothetical protein
LIAVFVLLVMIAPEMVTQGFFLRMEDGGWRIQPTLGGIP